MKGDISFETLDTYISECYRGNGARADQRHTASEENRESPIEPPRRRAGTEREQG